MRHEIRDSNSLHFTMEVVIGGTPVTGLAPNIRIFSVNNNEYWDFSAKAWDAYDPNPGDSTGLMSPVDNVGMPGVYNFDATAFGVDDIFNTAPNDNADEGYIVRMEDSASGLLEYVYIVISDLMTSSATIPAVVDANVVEWSGSAVSGAGGIPDVDVVSSITVNANIVDWNGLGATLTIGTNTSLPQISVKGWHADEYDDTVSTFVGTEGYTLGQILTIDDGAGGFKNYIQPNINVSDWNGESDDPAATGGVSTATLSIGDDTKLPNISVKGWWDVDDDSDGLVHGKLDSSGASNEILPNINVSDWNETAATLGVGSVSNLPQISVTAWGDQVGGRDTNGGALGTGPEDTYVAWTQDANPLGATVNVPNVRTQIIADNAIDEAAIEIDAVTYSELSTSAAREISDAVWSADIFKSIYNDNATGTPAPAPLGTIGHAITIDHLKDGINYWSATESTPAHKCAFVDPTGTKFYSHHLASSALSPAQITAYIDRSVTIIKDFDFDAMEFDAGSESYLGRIISVGQDGDGQYFELSLVDEAASAIPGGFKVDEDVIIIKAETDSTMHEVAHEVWEESVFDHETPDTFGMFSRIMTGLAQFNHRITDSTYDDSGRLLACRLVVYPTPEDADNATNSLTSVVVTSTYDEKQNMSTFLAREEDDGA